MRFSSSLHQGTIRQGVIRYACLCLWAALSAASLCAAEPTRIFLLSLDGLGQQLFDQDPAARELVTLHQMRADGASAKGVQAAFPSTTGNSHAALWTGVYGDQNGIVGNANPILPRHKHGFMERRQGFRSESLLVEPIWVKAARSGKRVVAHQVSQAYPFSERSAGLSLPIPPAVSNSYQTRQVSPYQVLRAKYVDVLPGSPWTEPLPLSKRPVRHFGWNAGPFRMVASLVAEANEADYDVVYIGREGQTARVRVALAPVETDWPKGRTLARHFSEPLLLELPDQKLTLSACFRLWETAPDGGFLLLQTPLQELGLSHGKAEPAALAHAAATEVGPLIGNGPSLAYLTGLLGKPLDEGGDGTAELRILECLELLTRQYNRHSEWLWKRFQPELMVDYFPFPDELDHGWLGLSATASPWQTRFQEFRRRGYQMVEARIAFLRKMAGESARFAVVSDHGMRVVTKNVNINSALREVGYLQLDENEQVNPHQSRAFGDYGILLNTEDWRDGIIPLHQKDDVLRDLSAKLGGLRDPETGAKLFRSFHTEKSSRKSLGIGGPAGFDLYFDLMPGYAPERKHVGPVVEPLSAPRGRHGFLSTRPDMLAIFVAVGPDIPKGRRWPRMRSTQVAPMVLQWLGISSQSERTESRTIHEE